MMAVFIALTAVAVERYINRRRLRLHEVLADVGWLTLIFVFIEFAYLFFVETLTLSYGVATRLLWYTEWPVFKGLMLDAAVGVLLIFTSLWLENAWLRIELRRPRLQSINIRQSSRRGSPASQKKCDIEWREAAT